MLNDLLVDLELHSYKDDFRPKQIEDLGFALRISFA